MIGVKPRSYEETSVIERDDRFARLYEAYPIAALAWNELYEVVDVGGCLERAIETTISELDDRNLAALFALVRAWIRPHRLEPWNAERWVLAYATIEDMVDSEAADRRGWELVS